MFKAAADNGYKVIMWTKDTVDWRDKSADLVQKRTMQNLNGGDLILMHPTAHTLKALPNILAMLKMQGYTVVPVTQNINAV